MTDKYYKFTDAHPTGGVATVTITEHQILEHMRQFTDYTGFTDDQLIMKFAQDRKALAVSINCDEGDDCLKGTDKCDKGDECKDEPKDEPEACNRGDQCCKKVMSGFVPDRRDGRDL